MVMKEGVGKIIMMECTKKHEPGNGPLQRDGESDYISVASLI